MKLAAAELGGESIPARIVRAYSASQQLITSGWNVVFAMFLVCWVFGWSGGKDLVEASYREAKVKSRELKDRHRGRRAA